MFGVTPHGKAISKLLFRRMNPDRERPGPVTVFILNGDFDVRIEVDGGVLQGESSLRQLEGILLESALQVVAR
jgi:hypothetical protein